MPQPLFTDRTRATLSRSAPAGQQARWPGPMAGCRAVWLWLARTLAARSTPVAEVRQLGQLVGHARGTARHLPHVLSGSVILALRLRARPLVHRPSPRDQVNQRTQPRDDDDEEGPHGFSPSGQVMITENIGEDRDEHPDPGEQEHEPEDRKQNVPERRAELQTSSGEHVELRAIESSAVPSHSCGASPGTGDRVKHLDHLSLPRSRSVCNIALREMASPPRRDRLDGRPANNFAYFSRNNASAVAMSAISFGSTRVLL
jgi:hypothetical protein